MFNVKFGATRAVTVALSERDSVNSFIEPLDRGRSEFPTAIIARRRVGRPIARANGPQCYRIAEDVCGAHTPLVDGASVRINTTGSLPYCWSFIWLIALERICLDNRQVAHFES